MSPSSPQERNHFKTAKALVGVAIGSVFAWLALDKLNWLAVGSALRGASLNWVGFALVCLGAGYGMRLVRSWIMLLPMNPDLRLTQCVRPFFGSYALNNVLPFRAGDIARVFAFQNEVGIHAEQIAGTMVIERVLDLLCVIVFFVSTVNGSQMTEIPSGVISGMTAAAGGGGFLLLLLVFAPRQVARFLEARNAKGKFAGQIAGFLDSLAILRCPKRVATLVILSFAAWLLEGCAFASAAIALHEQSGLKGSLFAMSVGTLSTVIPSTPGAVGVFDYFTALAYRGYGSQPELSTIVALVVHAVLWLPITVAGLLVLIPARRRRLDFTQPTAPGEPI